LLHGKALLVTTPHDLENITLELLTQSITIDLLRDPFVEKETPVVDTKVLAIGTKQIKQSRSETSYMQS